jgi:single-strand DNA-binding protein
MNSFTLTAVGNLTRNPELVAKGDVTYTRFCLVGNDYVGKDEEGVSREIVTSLWFVAFGPLGESLVRNARKGDQLIVEARVRASHWTDKQGEKQYDHDFLVQGFRFGAPGKLKREEREQRREEASQRGEERVSGREGNPGTGKPGADARPGGEGKSVTNGKSGADTGPAADKSILEGKSVADASLDNEAKTNADIQSGVDAESGTRDSAAKGGGAPTSYSHGKPAAQRAGRRATAPPP